LISADLPAITASPTPSPIEHWLDLADLPGPFLLRTQDWYVKVSVSGMAGRRQVGGATTGVQFTATQVEEL